MEPSAAQTSFRPLNLLCTLANLVLLSLGIGPVRRGIATEDAREANLCVDLFDALKVGLRCALGAKDDVLFERWLA